MSKFIDAPIADDLEKSDYQIKLPPIASASHDRSEELIRVGEFNMQSKQNRVSQGPLNAFSNTDSNFFKNNRLTMRKNFMNLTGVDD